MEDEERKHGTFKATISPFRYQNCALKRSELKDSEFLVHMHREVTLHQFMLNSHFIVFTVKRNKKRNKKFFFFLSLYIRVFFLKKTYCLNFS